MLKQCGVYVYGFLLWRLAEAKLVLLSALDFQMVIFSFQCFFHKLSLFFILKPSPQSIHILIYITPFLPCALFTL